MLYSKLGSIPKPQTDGTEGWIEVPDAPECPEGKEVVWWGSEWVIRDPKPVDRAGYQWNWNHSDKIWVEGKYATTGVDEVIETIELTFAADSLNADSLADSLT
jgi:hypothetical protein